MDKEDIRCIALSTLKEMRQNVDNKIEYEEWELDGCKETAAAIDSVLNAIKIAEQKIIKLDMDSYGHKS